MLVSGSLMAQQPGINYSTKTYNFTKGLPVSNFTPPTSTGSSIPSTVQGNIVEAIGIGVYDAGKITGSSDGNVVSVITDSGIVQKVNLGTRTAQNLTTGRDKPWGVVRDSQGNIYWAETGSFTIVINPNQNDETSTAGSILSGLGMVSDILPGKIGDVVEGINTVREIYSGLTGDDLIREISGQSTPPPYILKFSGKIYKLAPGSSTPVEFVTGIQMPTGLAIDKDNNLYVSCFTAKFKVEGGVQFSGGSVEVVDDYENTYSSKIIKIAPDKTITNIGAYPGIDYPTAIGVDDNYKLYIQFYTDNFTKTKVAAIPKFAAGVTSGDTYKTANLLVDKTALYEDMAVDRLGNVYISDFRSDKIYVCPAASTQLNQLLVFSDKIRAPKALYVDRTNNQLWVKDGKFINTGSFKKLGLFGYNISPALPEGLILNNDGSISGTPKVVSASQSYTISVSNSNGYGTDVITIAVKQIATPAINYATSSYSFPVASSISPIPAPANTGGAFNQQKGPLKVDSVYKGGTAIEGFAFDANGNRYFTQPDSGRIMKVTPSGTSTIFLSNLNYPVDIAIDNNTGFFYFSERSANKVKLLYPGFNTPIDLLIVGTPSGLAIDATGNLYVLNQGSGTIIKYDPRTNTIKDGFVTGLYQPYNISIYDNTMYIRGIDGVIKKIPTNNPTSITTFVTVESSWGMTLDDYGNIYVTGYGGIKKIPTGTNTPQPFATSLNTYYTRAIEVDANNNLYVSSGEHAKQNVLKLTADGYTVSPALPAGLVLNDNGTISGTPTTISAAQNYTVSASNTAGTGSAVVNIAITNIPTTNLTYTTPLNLSRGIAITTVTPTTAGGVPSGYTISPSLPSGLSLDGTTGKISGTPTANQSETSYTVTANNPAGGRTAVVKITISDLAPSALTYNFPHSELMKDYSIGSISPAYNGSSASSFSISPTLPAGLVFNTSTGIITGTPTATSSTTTYTVTMNNGGGSTTVSFTLSVTPAPIPNIAYATNEYIFLKGKAITAIPAPTNTGNPFPQQRIRDTAILGTASVTGVTLDADGNAYVAYSTGGIKKLAKGANQLQDFITSGISSPVDLVVDKDGNMYVSEGSNNSIKKIVLTTKSISTFVNSGLGNVQGLYISKSNDLYVADYTNNKIVKYTNCVAGSKSDVLTGLNDEYSYGTKPYDVTIDTLGNMYVLLSGPVGANDFSYIYKYPAGGGARSQVTSQVNKYTYIIVDKAGNVYYSSTRTGIQRVNVFNNSNNGGINSNLSSSATAYGLALDGDENVFYGINSATAATGGLGISYQFGYNTASLPAGLALNPNGTITGTPTTLQSKTEHSISVSSFYGSSTAKLKITIVDEAPSFAYSTANNTLTKNVTNISLVPVSTGGPISSYTISPTGLPAGLTFNSTTGKIEGKATILQDTISTYIVSATNSGGTGKDTVTFKVVDVVPSAISYQSNNILYVNKSFTELKPTVTGGGPVTQYSVSPDLPTGVHLDAITGVISGSPASVQASKSYSIKAENSGGFVTATINIAVNDVAPQIGYAPDSSFKFKQNVTITAIPKPANAGGPILSYTTTGLPVGLTLNSDGSITGTPTQIKTSTQYQVIADGGTWGKDTAYLSIEIVPLPPDSIKYNSPITIVKGSAMQPQSSSFTTSGGGAITNYSISPELPPGLTINSSTGVISGTPTSILSTDGQIYYVIAENSAGKTSAPFMLLVKDLPPAINYTGDNVFTLGIDTALTVSSTGGEVKKYSISPALPTGLVLDSITGKISGNPAALSAKTKYTVTARNYDNPVATKEFYLTVVDKKPVISYASPHVFTKAVAISAINVSSTGGAVVSYNISPALPGGLSIDESTGTISGTATVSSSATDYTITAQNTGGSATVVINIRVINAKPDINYTSPNIFIKGVIIDNLQPISTGGDEITYSISSELPNGLSFDTQTGIISGTPTDTTAVLEYDVIAINNGGKDTATFSIKVNDKAPGNIVYATPNKYYVGTAITDLSPTVDAGGGSIVKFSVNPSTLPLGLSFNTTTGVVSGTPTTEFSETTFTVTAHNSGGTSQSSFSISVISLSATISKTDVNCYGAANGTATVVVTGGALPISYSWSPSGGTNATAQGLIAGDYTCTITDGNGKSIQKEITIGQPLQAMVNNVDDIAVCYGGNINEINFSGSNATGYAWTNDNPSIGLGAVGTGNITAFVGENTTADIQFAHITVTAKDNTCSGNSKTFTIAIKPAVTISQPDNLKLCNGTASGNIQFEGNATGTNYNWTSENTSIGLAASGNGNILSFSGSNDGATPVVSIISVTSSANGCTGETKDFSITINPTPSLDAISDQSICNNASTNAIDFTGGTNNTTYTWVNNNPSIGIAASGSGNIASFKGKNNNNSNSNNAIITVTPESDGCAGEAKDFSIIVNPTPAITLYASPSAKLSPTDSTNISASSSIPGNGTFNWYKNDMPYKTTSENVLNNLKIDDIGAYKVVYEDQNGCISNPSTVVVISAAKPLEVQVVLFPNPSKGKFVLRVSKEPSGGYYTIKVLNNNGKPVHQVRATPSRPYEAIEVDLPMIANGIYRVLVIDDKGKLVQTKTIMCNR